MHVAMLILPLNKGNRSPNNPHKVQGFQHFIFTKKNSAGEYVLIGADPTSVSYLKFFCLFLEFGRKTRECFLFF